MEKVKIKTIAEKDFNEKFTSNEKNEILKYYSSKCTLVQLRAKGINIPKNLRNYEIMMIYFSISKDIIIDPFWGFSEGYYRSTYQDVSAAIREGQFINGFHHWALHGQREKRSINDFSTSSWRRQEIQIIRHKLMYSLFDVEYYKSIIGIPHAEISRDMAVQHFLRYGLLKGVVPTQEFDEEFYISYYEDIKIAKKDGRIPSGFYHYILSGEIEERLPLHDPAEAVKRKLGSLSDQIGFANVTQIEARIKEIKINLQEDCVRINIFIPAMDGDILFGGYIAFFHFLCRLAERGHRLRFIILEDGQSNKSWFLKCIKTRPRWLNAFESQEFVNASAKEHRIKFGNSDRFIAYSAWTALDAYNISQKINGKKILFFIQEYEPIFHKHDSFRFIVEMAYNQDHFALFNTSILLEYFRDNRLGVFSDIKNHGEAMHFDHALADVAPASEAFYVNSCRRRRLAFYARPEAHAGRNLFEIGLLALKRACSAGWIPDNWELVGLGSLGQSMSVDVVTGYSLQILPRVDQSQYELMLQSFDVGLSLMWAPHPSIIPFELAKAGCICVTNEFGTRDRGFLARFGQNLEVATPSVEGIAYAIRRAVARSDDYQGRIKASQFEWSTSWDKSFSPEFFEELEEKWVRK